MIVIKSLSYGHSNQEGDEAILAGKAEEKRKTSKSHDEQKTYAMSLAKAQFITNSDEVKQRTPT